MHKRMSPHGNYDYIGNATYLVDNFKIKNVYFNYDTYDDLGNSLVLKSDKYFEKQVKEVGKKYNRRTLLRMKQFSSVISDEKVPTLSEKFTWSHYTELLSFNNNIMGILICKRENKFVIEYCSDARIAVREYKLV